jgi:8-oxo-dGTP diphosphatase
MMVLPVAAAWLKNKQGRILICRRKEDKAQGGYWEFPGGKIEEGETAGQALERELKEELNISVKAGKILSSKIHDYPELTIELILVEAIGSDEKITLTDHSAYKWINPQELENFDMAPADRGLWEKIIPPVQPASRLK